MRPERVTRSVQEASEALGISRSLAYELVRRGELTSLRLGRRIVVPVRGLEALVDHPRRRGLTPVEQDADGGNAIGSVHSWSGSAGIQRACLVPRGRSLTMRSGPQSWTEAPTPTVIGGSLRRSWPARSTRPSTEPKPGGWCSRRTGISTPQSRAAPPRSDAGRPGCRRVVS